MAFSAATYLAQHLKCRPGELRRVRGPVPSYLGDAADYERHGRWIGSVVIGNVRKIGNRRPARRVSVTWRADAARTEIVSDERVVW